MTRTQHASRTLSPVPAQAGDHHAPAHQPPKAPTVAWSAAGCRRRTRVSRAVLLTILAFQAMLSLRLSNTAFEEEALSLTAGHAEVSRLLHGTPVQIDHAAYFSGSPRLYPVLAAVVDSQFGLSGVRLLSLLFMLGTTALLYSFTRRLFSERAGLAAAGLFSVVQSTIVMGHFATYDAPAVFLLAWATWIVVRTAGMSAPSVLLAAPVAVLAVGVTYAAGLYLPTIVALALLTALPHRRGGALLRSSLLGLGVSALLVLGVYGTDLSAGVRQAPTSREHGSDGVVFLLEQSVAWGGPLFLAAVAGAISYARRHRLHESPPAPGAGGPGPVQRSLLGALLCATALLAPAYQMHSGTVVALFEHVGFGLLFAAPMAGVGLTRLVGAHFRHTHLGIALWSAMLCIGMAQADWRLESRPDSSTMIRTISSHVDREGHYLSSTPEVPAYHLRDRTSHRQWQGVFGMQYTDRRGARHTGADAYRQALRDGEFDLVVLDGVTNPRMNGVIADALERNPHYRLLAALPFHSAGDGVRDHLLRAVPRGEHDGRYRIWSRR
ncbi:ArnT family glycosyltransferase [Streptomyces sp. NPDC051109]|uniref:ArnT family glycosyltransferase n=1 Tax=Streptomyces sp. NPDC051109 TaxID=3365642 RepID=UPI0037B44CB7